MSKPRFGSVVHSDNRDNCFAGDCVVQRVLDDAEARRLRGIEARKKRRCVTLPRFNLPEYKDEDE